MARYLRECRREAGLTLREVHELTAASGEPIPSSTVCKIEQGKVEPGLLRVRKLLEVYEKPLHQAADLLELEALAGPAPEGVGPEGLAERGEELLKEGQIKDGLACLLPLRQLGAGPDEDPDSFAIRQRAMLLISIGLQQLGKHRLALNMVEELLTERPDPALLVNAHVQAGRLWLDLGSVEIALAFFCRAREHVAEDDHKRRAWVLGCEANVLALGGDFDKAIARSEEAVALLELTGDRHNLVGSFGQIARFELRLGRPKEALTAARRGLELGEGHAFEERATRLHLIEGRALVELGEADLGLVKLKNALTSAIERDDLALQFLAHYHLWKAHLALENPLRAEFEVQAARSYLRFSEENGEEAREVREAVEKRRGATQP